MRKTVELEQERVVFQQVTAQTDRQQDKCRASGIIPTKSIDCYLPSGPCPEYWQGCPIMKKAAGELK